MVSEQDRINHLEGERSLNAGGITENVVANMMERCGIDLYYFERDWVIETPEGPVRDRIEIDFVAELGMDLVAIEVKSGSNRASNSLKKLRMGERYRIYPITRFIKFEPGNIRVDDSGVEHYPLFAAAFADSIGRKANIVFEGYKEIEL